jgi:hypothetical protein
MRWPSAIVQHIEHPAPDRTLRTEEADPKPAAEKKEQAVSKSGETKP